MISKYNLLAQLLNKKVMLKTTYHNYMGILIDINSNLVKLEFTETNYNLQKNVHIELDAIESFGTYE